jgi:hypothetical protein
MFLLEDFSCLKGEANHLGESSDSNISSFSLYLGLVQRKNEIFIINVVGVVKGNTVHHFIFKEDNWVIISNRSLKETSKIFYIPRYHDLKSRD